MQILKFIIREDLIVFPQKKDVIVDLVWDLYSEGLQ